MMMIDTQLRKFLCMILPRMILSPFINFQFPISIRFSINKHQQQERFFPMVPNGEEAWKGRKPIEKPSPTGACSEVFGYQS
ncbi:hypothetical protein CsatA_004829 [Cannabis sativa]